MSFAEVGIERKIFWPGHCEKCGGELKGIAFRKLFTANGKTIGDPMGVEVLCLECKIIRSLHYKKYCRFFDDPQI